LIWSSGLGTGGVPDDEALRAIWARLEAEGRARVVSWFGGAVETRRAADMRYGEQVFVIGVPLDGTGRALPVA
jgi:N-methylhydantoinase A